jgi:hypothetical protein
VKREFKKLRYFISTCIFWMGDECCKRTVHSLYYIYTSQTSKPNPITTIYTCLGDHPACIAGTSGPSRVYLGTGRQSPGAIEARAPMPIRKKRVMAVSPQPKFVSSLVLSMWVATCLLSCQHDQIYDEAAKETKFPSM